MAIPPAPILDPGTGASYSCTRAKDTQDERTDVEALMKRSGCNRVEHHVDEGSGVLRSYGYPQ